MTALLSYYAGYKAAIEAERRRALGIPDPPSPPPPPPPACVGEVLAIMAAASSDERAAIIEAVQGAYCMGCGGMPHCRCQNDE